MTKKIISVLSATALIFGTIAGASYGWATEAVNFCVERKILSGTGNGDLALEDGLTREQMAKMLCDSFGIEPDTSLEPVFEDLTTDSWSYGYVSAIASKLFGGVLQSELNPTELVSREEFCATMILAYGMTGGYQRNARLLDFNFTDTDEITAKYKKLITVAVERGLMSGSEGKLNPKANLTRAEACSFLHRAISVKEGKMKIDPKELGVIQSRTSMTGESAVTLEQAQAWATERGATESFIAAAEYYWKYGEITTIRPEILYAQSAKETGFGKYGGAVLPEQNNFAGIKKYGHNGDATEDHETFETQEDGVRAHFNHMTAYLGLEPVGETHGRYKSIKSMPWAGSVELLEELGGKWCPDLYYGFSILHDYIEPMMKGN
ncbi:MAG: S-layer homology domain-containing protein [Clostridia bacterium]|nr:S-layer homology domain-containing protein [Clostridia bacterium]